MGKTAVVIGAGGGIGRALCEALLTGGYRVIGVTRSGNNLPAGVESHLASQRLTVALEQADIAFWALNLPYSQWVSRLPLQFNTLVQGLQQTSTPVVWADNLYNYGPLVQPKPHGTNSPPVEPALSAEPGLRLTEDTPWRPIGPKEQLRARLNAEFHDLVGSGIIRGLIGKSSDYIGPHAPNSVPFATVINPISEGKKPRLLGPGDRLHTIADVRDTARALIVIGEHLLDSRHSVPLNCVGEPTFHLPAAPTLTWGEFTTIAQAVWAEQFAPPGSRVSRDYGTLPAWQQSLAELMNLQIRHTREIMHQYTGHWHVDHEEFVQKFGAVETTPVEQSLRDTFEWIVSVREGLQ